MSGDWSEPLDALRWHWGEAYVINCHGLGRWTAHVPPVCPARSQDAAP